MDCSTRLPAINLPKGDFSNPLTPSPDELPNFWTLPSEPTVACSADAAHAGVEPEHKFAAGHTTLSARGAAACIELTEAPHHAALVALVKLHNTL